MESNRSARWPCRPEQFRALVTPTSVGPDGLHGVDATAAQSCAGRPARNQPAGSGAFDVRRFCVASVGSRLSETPRCIGSAFAAHCSQRRRVAGCSHFRSGLSGCGAAWAGLSWGSRGSSTLAWSTQRTAWDRPSLAPTSGRSSHRDGCRLASAFAAAPKCRAQAIAAQCAALL
jgi:hypothetical protein